MQEILLDCQGLPCPQPVLRCKDAISTSPGANLKIIVDNPPAKENVSRFLTSQSYKILDVQEDNGLIRINSGPDTEMAKKEEPDTLDNSPTDQTTAKENVQDKQLVLITSDVIGHGDDVLGDKLMQNFITTLPEMGDSLWRLILINAGVRLAIQGSHSLENLKRIEESGVSILVCGTCLDHFNLLEQKQVGQTTNMLDVVTSLQLASKVIKV